MKFGLLVVGDHSGSMGQDGKIDEARNGINTLLDTEASENPESLVSVVIFDDYVDTLIKDVMARIAPRLTPDNFSARGMTRLYDAIGLAIKEQIERFNSLPDYEKPEKVFVQIFTDGLENASREFNSATIKALIEEQRGKGWEFLFVGTSEASAMAARNELGINLSVHTTDTGKGTRSGYSAAMFARSAYRDGEALYCCDVQSMVDEGNA